MAPMDLEARSLARRFQRLVILIGLPIIILVLLLILREYEAHRERELGIKRIGINERIVQIEAIVRAANVHLSSMRFAMEFDMRSKRPVERPLPPMDVQSLQPTFIMSNDGIYDQELKSIVIAIPKEISVRAGAEREFFAALRLRYIQHAAHTTQNLFKWSYYVSASKDFISLYPYRSLEKMLGGSDHYKAMKAYYDYDIYRMTTRENNPERKAIWTPVYYDSSGQELMVSHNAPIDFKDQQIGMIGTDVVLSVLSDALGSVQENGEFFVIVDQTGAVAGDSMKRAAKEQRIIPGSELLGVDLASLVAGEFKLIGDDYFYAADIKGAPWKLIYRVPQAVIAGAALQQVILFFIFSAILVLTIVLSYLLVRRNFVRPAIQLVGTIETLAASGIPETAKVPEYWKPWFQRISETFASLRQTNKKLDDERIKSKSIIDVALDAVVTTDQDGKIIDFNPSAEHMFGHAREDAVGKRIGDVIIPEKSRAAHNAGMERLKSSGVSRILGQRLEVEAQHATGRVFPVELQIHEIRHIEGVNFVAYIRDLTEVHRNREEIEVQREAIYQNEKLAALGSLLAGVAHELNNPLSIVIGQALMLREATEDASKPADVSTVADRAGRIESAANRCVRIVRTFLAMARQRNAERKSVNVQSLVESVLDLLAYGLRTASVTVEKDVPENLPPIWADADHLHQVLVNLIVNAKQALEETSSPNRRILVSAREDKKTAQVMLSVIDNGPGVPERIRNRIFDPFFTTKSQDVGTGIGLAVSRGLVEAIGGTLVLEPTPRGSGACFVIRLPIGLQNEDEGAAVDVKTLPIASATSDRPAPQALIVDDEPEIAHLLSELLSNFGYQSDIAPSGSKAREQLKSLTNDYNIVLCDIRMPDGDGPSFYDWLLAERPELARRIGFVTGDTLGPAAGRFLARSGCPVVEKPFNREDIRRLVEILDPRKALSNA